MIQQKNIALCIILSIVTCGIYGLIWFIKLTDDTNAVTPPSPTGKPYTSGGIALLLMIVTCDIYGIYWAYKQGEKLDNAKAARGLPTSNQAVIYLILQLFFPIIGWAMMQSQLNEMAPPTQTM
ncbi:MAG: DUF4234 domain-containing protein [Ruminiclostridium sp.]|nr:DUF4234 domain-containing protein [Ruminiclostridium sp.]MDE6725494.1 DUF4234 domain-containing protein [Ruminiclostridium sp.]